MNWKRITRGEVDVRGVNKKYPGLLDVRIPLSEVPPREWTGYFERPVGISISMSMHPPHLSGAEVVLRPSDDDLEEYVQHVDERIQAANVRYEREVLPQLRALEAQQQREAAEVESRLEAARKRAKKL